MKCTDCQGTGLENQNKICPNCKGFGKVGNEEDERAIPEVKKVEKIKKAKVEKPAKEKKSKK